MCCIKSYIKKLVKTSPGRGWPRKDNTRENIEAFVYIQLYNVHAFCLPPVVCVSCVSACTQPSECRRNTSTNTTPLPPSFSVYASSNLYPPHTCCALAFHYASRVYDKLHYTYIIIKLKSNTNEDYAYLCRVSKVVISYESTCVIAMTI